MIKHLKMLKKGQAVDCPVYDYSAHNRSQETIHIEPKKIILAEGILLLADPLLRSMMDIKIYVEADADERILRRIVRDVKERGRDLDNIVDQYLTTVKPMHYLYVEPTRALADNFTSLLSYFYKHYRNIVQSAIPICCQYQLCADL